MKYNLNKDLIEGLRDSTNNEFVGNINFLIYSLIEEAVKELVVKSSFIQLDKIRVEPVNEIYLGAVCSNSEYTYFLGIPNKEIELNSLEKKHYFKNKFGENPIFLYRNELEKLVGEELLEIDGDYIKLTEKGIDLANLVWEEFV